MEFSSRRSVVYGKRGVVAATQPLSVSAGLKILELGGNAADAAVAASAVLTVTEPTSCGIGGDAFCLFYNAKDKKVSGFNGSGRSPKALTLEKARELGLSGTEIPLHNANAATVPGCVAAWQDTVEWYGSGKVSLEQILQPSVDLARNGFPVSEISANMWKSCEKFALGQPNGHELFVSEHGSFRAPKSGELYQNERVAAVLERIGKEGRDAFYKGAVAEAIVQVIQENGGVMTLQDLAEHSTTQVEPLSMDFRGVTLHEIPPNGQGIVALEALGLLKALEEREPGYLDSIEHNTLEWFHTLIELVRLSFADASKLVADIDYMNVDPKDLLSPEYLRERIQVFDKTKAKADVVSGSPPSSSDTVYLSVVDEDGNACSYIQSVYTGFGSGVVPRGQGFALQSRGNNFKLIEGHANSLAGGKRPYHTIIPAMVTRADGELYMSYGVMGGFMQPQGHVQTLLNMVVKNLGPQASLDKPRFCISASQPREGGDIDNVVYIEAGVPDEIVEKLRDMGHDARVLHGGKRALFGRGQIIHRLSPGVWAAGSDPRGDGHAGPQI